MAGWTISGVLGGSSSAWTVLEVGRTGSKKLGSTATTKLAFAAAGLEDPETMLGN